LWNKNRQMIQDLYSTAVEQWDWASEDQFNDAQSVIGGVLRGSRSVKAEAKTSFKWN